MTRSNTPVVAIDPGAGTHTPGVETPASSHVAANEAPPPIEATAATAAVDPLCIWIVDDTHLERESDGAAAEPAPPGVTPCALTQAQAWLTGGAPAWLRARRIDGIIFTHAADAPATVRRAARALRERLCPRDAGGLRELAMAWGHRSVAAALARMRPHQQPSFADLARALPRDEEDARRTARLLWALEHL